MDLDLRKLRYFVAVAQHAGFRRAAGALHLAQPALTRQIRALEHDLGVRLFIRSARGCELTEAGRRLLEEAGPLLLVAEALQRRVSDASAAVPRLRIGYTPGVFIAQVVKAYSRQHPEVVVDFLGVPPRDQARLLRQGRLDVCFTRLPTPLEGLSVVPLFEEHRVVALPGGHPLTRCDRIAVHHLAGLSLLPHPGAVPELHAPNPPVRGEDGREVGDASAATIEDQLEHVAAGFGVLVLPHSTAALYTRPGVVYRAVDGLAPSLVVLAWVGRKDTGAGGSGAGAAQVRDLIQLAVTLMGTPGWQLAGDGGAPAVRGDRARSA